MWKIVGARASSFCFSRPPLWGISQAHSYRPRSTSEAAELTVDEVSQHEGNRGIKNTGSGQSGAYGWSAIRICLFKDSCDTTSGDGVQGDMIPRLAIAISGALLLIDLWQARRCMADVSKDATKIPRHQTSWPLIRVSVLFTRP